MITCDEELGCCASASSCLQLGRYWMMQRGEYEFLVHMARQDTVK